MILWGPRDHHSGSHHQVPGPPLGSRETQRRRLHASTFEYTVKNKYVLYQCSSYVFILSYHVRVGGTQKCGKWEVWFHLQSYPRVWLWFWGGSADFFDSHLGFLGLLMPPPLFSKRKDLDTKRMVCVKGVGAFPVNCVLGPLKAAPPLLYHCMNACLSAIPSSHLYTLASIPWFLCLYSPILFSCLRYLRLPMSFH